MLRWWCPREHGDTTLSQVIGLFHSHFKVNVTANDVAETRRLPKGRHDRVIPVIVRFDNRRSRDLIYSARRELYLHQSTSMNI